MMSSAKAGDSVRVHYTGKLQDGTVFDTSEGRDPLAFTVGAGQVIPGFEQAVAGMEVGQTLEVRIPPDDGYGERRDDLVLEVEREQIPSDIEVELGSQLALQQPDGQSVPVTVTSLDESTVTLDANHPLAGKELLFEVELVGID